MVSALACGNKWIQVGTYNFTNDVDFVDKAYAQICNHSLFTLQFR